MNILRVGQIQGAGFGSGAGVDRLLMSLAGAQREKEREREREREREGGQMMSVWTIWRQMVRMDKARCER